MRIVRLLGLLVFLAAVAGAPRPAIGADCNLNGVEDEREIDSVAAEMVDRFGKAPPEVELLLRIVAIKALCRRAHIEKN